MSSEDKDDHDHLEEGASGGDGKESKDEDEESIGYLQKLLERFGIHVQSKKEDEEVKYPQLLDEVTFDGIAKYIQSDKCNNIVVMAGAGISTAAGIPDFRTPGSGLYDNLQQYNLPYPQAIFELNFFRQNPEPFFKLAKELFPGNFKPTTSHYFVKLLNEKGLLLRHYTQNIDSLERLACIPEDKLVEAHGTSYSAHCLKCRKSYNFDWLKREVFADKIPMCVTDGCEGVVKPDIVFFGESLPKRFSSLLSQDMPRCDLLIIMGTSLAVQPFASLVDHVPKTTPRLLINREKCGQSSSLNFLACQSGLMFDDPKNYRDVAWLGSCDEGSLALADLLGWKEELINLIEREHKKIDEVETNSENQSEQPHVADNNTRENDKVPGSNTSAVDEPGSDMSVVNKPGINLSVVNEPGSHTSVVNEPGSNINVVNEPVNDMSVVNEPGSNTSEVNEPGSNTSVVNEPGSNTSVVKVPVNEMSVVNVPGSNTSVVKE